MNRTIVRNNLANQKNWAKPVFTFFLLLFFYQGIQAQKPNILFIVSDDLNTRIGPYMEIDDHTPAPRSARYRRGEIYPRFLSVPVMRPFAGIVYERVVPGNQQGTHQ